MIDTPRSVSTFPAAIFLACAGSALIGGYWDDAWHTDRGRDSFFIAPHVTIYLGIFGAGAVLGFLVVATARALGPSEVLRDPLLRLALLAEAGTLASAPIDNAWHEAFGRDAVLWSPPHMLGIVGAMGLAASLLLLIRDRGTTSARSVIPVAAGLVVAAAMFSVAEYETDVPQFAATWYPPVFALAAALSLALVRTCWPGRWSATAAATVHALTILAASAILLGMGFEAVAIPTVLACAVVVDLAARRGTSMPRTALGLCVVVFAVIVPARQIFADLGADTGQLLVALPLTWVAAILGLWIGSGGRVVDSGRPAARLALATTALVLLLAGTATAHDPGQGPDAGTTTWRIQRSGAALVADVTVRPCPGAGPAALVARRGGQIIRVAVRSVGCKLRGRLALPDSGRWFVYAEYPRAGRRIESWIPVIRDADGPSEERDRYAFVAIDESTTVAQVISGGVIYAAILGFLLAVSRMARGRLSYAP